MSDFSSLDHLERHHRDFAEFRDLMISSARGRFGPVFWALFDGFCGEHLENGGTFVDLGTGPGVFLEWMRERYPRSELIGVEVQPEMLESARERVGKLEGAARIVEADLANPPLEGIASSSVGAVLASMVLHEMPMPMPTRLLQEVHRILKPGGRFVLFDWIRHPLREYRADLPVDESDEVLLDLFQHFAEHCSYTVDDLEFMAEKCGLVSKNAAALNRGKHAVLLLEKPQAP